MALNLDDLRRIRRYPTGSVDNGVTLTIGDFAVRLVFDSPALRAAVLPALQHLMSEDIPTFTIHLHEFGNSPLAVKIGKLLAPLQHRDEVRLMDGPEMTCFAQNRGTVLAAVDWSRNEAYWMVREAKDICYLERSGPLRLLLTLLLARRQQFLVHAAAVGDIRGGVLILGHGGAGKSTTALVCLESGLEYVGDDHCLVQVAAESGALVVNSLFSTGKLALKQLEDFPLVSAAAAIQGRPSGEKVVLYPARLAALNLSRRLLLRAILVAKITGREETTLRRIPHSHAFRAIAPSCALHFPSTRADALKCFGRLVRDLPSFVVELGSDREAIPAAIRSLLAGRH